MKHINLNYAVTDFQQVHTFITQTLNYIKKYDLSGFLTFNYLSTQMMVICFKIYMFIYILVFSELALHVLIHSAFLLDFGVGEMQ